MRQCFLQLLNVVMIQLLRIDAMLVLAFEGACMLDDLLAFVGRTQLKSHLQVPRLT